MSTQKRPPRPRSYRGLSVPGGPGHSRHLRPKQAHSLPAVEEVSAGGVCIRVDSGVPYVAIIARRNRGGKKEWCLPKGHLEPGETAAEAAEREIAEETGVRGNVLAHLCSIDYWFSGPRNRVHKTVHHFLLEWIDGDVTVENDPDHEAEEAAWLPLRKAASLLAYPNERRVIDIALELLYPETA